MPFTSSHLSYHSTFSVARNCHNLNDSSFDVCVDHLVNHLSNFTNSLSLIFSSIHPTLSGHWKQVKSLFPMSTLQISEDSWPLLRFFFPFDKYFQFFQLSFRKHGFKQSHALSNKIFIPSMCQALC